MKDYERGVQQATAIYAETIREYVIENEKLRKLVIDMWQDLDVPNLDREQYERRMCELEIEVPE